MGLVLVDIDAFGLPHDLLDLGLQGRLRLAHPVIAHRLVTGGIGLDLGAIEGHPAHRDHARLLAQGQRLQEQGFQRGEVTAPKAGDGAKVRCGVGGQVPKRHIVMATGFDLAR